MQVAEVILPRRLPGALSTLSYLVSDDLPQALQPGQLVYVPFRKQTEVGLVESCTAKSAITLKLKPFTSFINAVPALDSAQIAFLKELSLLYHGPIGQLLKANLFPLTQRNLKKFATLSSPDRLASQVDQEIQPRRPKLLTVDTSEVLLKILLDILDAPGQHLVIVPDLSDLATLFAPAFERYGSRVAVMSAELGNPELFRVWLGIWQGSIDIVLGTRRAFFLPWNNLRSIVVIKEGHPDHKSFDMFPRFNNREAAFLLARQHGGAEVYFLSHTVSVESFYFAEQRFYDSAANESTLAAHLGAVSFTDLSVEFPSGQQQPLFSALALTHLKQRSGPALVFVPERGAARLVRCADCAWIFSCSECQAPLRAEASSGALACHNCHKKSAILECALCHSWNRRLWSGGTQAVEKELRSFFPPEESALIRRIDGDSPLPDKEKIVFDSADIIISTRYAWPRINWNALSLFIGVGLEGVLTLPEYYANEHTWQLLREARFLLPTASIMHLETTQLDKPLFAGLTDPRPFYASELAERRVWEYPPFVFLVRFFYGNPVKSVTRAKAQRVFGRLQAVTSQQPKIQLFAARSLLPEFQNGRYWQVIVAKLAAGSYKRNLKDLLAVLPPDWKVDLHPQNLLR